MAVGGDMTTWEIEQKMKERTPNQCATLVYTVSYIQYAVSGLFGNNMRCTHAGRDNW